MYRHFLYISESVKWTLMYMRFKPSGDQLLLGQPENSLKNQVQIQAQWRTPAVRLAWEQPFKNQVQIQGQGRTAAVRSAWEQVLKGQCHKNFVLTETVGI